jgi:hypothetical protein
MKPRPFKILGPALAAGIVSVVAQIAVVPPSHRRGSSHPLKQRSISIRTRSFTFSKTTLVQSLAVGVAVKIRSQAQLGELTSRVRVVEGYYDLDTGKVAWTAK